MTDSISIRLDSKVYALDVVQRAAFRCSDLGYFEFSTVASAIVVAIIPKPGVMLEAEVARARFHNELLDQQLRKTIFDETKAERDLILAYAFSNTELLG